jgi:hypothetical protein
MLSRVLQHNQIVIDPLTGETVSNINGNGFFGGYPWPLEPLAHRRECRHEGQPQLQAVHPNGLHEGVPLWVALSLVRKEILGPQSQLATV